MSDERKTIVVSAVGIRKGGTLTILRDCLQFLSTQADRGEYRVIALVHKRALADYPRIEYLEMPDIIKGWGRRLWCEYVTMRRISKRLAPVYLWLSLHDTTPGVMAEHQAVYCQTSFPFYKWSWRDFLFDYKIPLFALFTRFAYQIHVHRNDYLIVQQEWLRSGFSRMLKVEEKKFIVAPPEKKESKVMAENIELPYFTFFYAATPDCHKNFELLCEAASLLEKEVGKCRFRVVLTIHGEENRYTRWLYKRFKEVESIEFAGFMSKEKLFGYYHAVDCLVFPSKVETWGLPISEFIPTGKPILLADLPYAHETAEGSVQTAFFDVSTPHMLRKQMRQLLERDTSFLNALLPQKKEEPCACSWEDMMNILLEMKFKK